MKVKYLFFFLSCIQLPAFANPGDDIWGHIGLLKNGVATANLEIQTLKQITSQLQGQLDAQNDVIKANQAKRYSIGQEYRGGLVFYVDETGQHGLIASKIDVNQEGIEWRNGASGNKVTNARGDGVGAGETNTRVIISQQTIDNQRGTFAALQAANFQVLGDGVTPCKTPILSGAVCYGGWYLPSAYELQLLHKNLHLQRVSYFAPDFYWSSTERSVSEAWLMQFATGELSASNKSNTIGRVRAVARF